MIYITAWIIGGYNWGLKGLFVGTIFAALVHLFLSFATGQLDKKRIN